MAKLPGGISLEKADIDGLPAAWISPETDPKTVMLYFHGGGYVSGSLGTHQMLCVDIARTVNARLLFVEYRLAPEQPFPAALEDAQKAYRWLLAQGFEAGNIFVAGDSAGGGLGLALTLSLRDAREPLPAGVVCISGWTDLTMSGASHHENAKAEVSLHPDSLRLWAFSYAGAGDLKNPLISPYFAEYAGFPPILIQVGSQEVLLDDARVVAEKAGSAGVDVTLSVYEGMWHVWHTLGTMLPEGRQAFEEIGKFVRKYT
jgi:acetyl esterase/lipase